MLQALTLCLSLKTMFNLSNMLFYFILKTMFILSIYLSQHLTYIATDDSPIATFESDVATDDYM